MRAGNLLFLAGKGVRDVIGKVGRDVTVEQAYQSARSTGLQLLAVMAQELGSLDSVRRIVKVTGFVNAVPEFADHPAVLNGCSDLIRRCVWRAWSARPLCDRSGLVAGSDPRRD